MAVGQPTQAPEEMSTLRSRALKGGAYIVVRQGLGMLLSLINVICVTRIIGPTQYGLFAAANGMVAFLATLGTWGIDVYLIRKPEPPTAPEYNQAFTLLLFISIVLLASLLAAHRLVAGALQMHEVTPLLSALAFFIPGHLLCLPGVVQLDRQLRFGRVAYNELISQTLNYVVAIPLALKGAGAWAPAAGVLTQQTSLLLLTNLAVKLHPRLHWDTGIIRQILGYGLGYSSSGWVWQLRTLVNPVIVGRLAGPQAVGYVAFSIRMVEVLAFAKTAAWRVALAALAQLGGDKTRLRRSIEEGMRLEVMAVGIPLACFAVVAPQLLAIFGQKWEPALRIFPFIAVAYLCNAMFNLHASVLYLFAENMAVTRFHLVHVAAFAGSAALLIPRVGFIGYGWAEIIALSSYVVLHLYVSKATGSPNYAAALLWFTVATASLALSQTPNPLRPLTLGMLLVPLLLPGERNKLDAYRRLLTGK